MGSRYFQLLRKTHKMKLGLLSRINVGTLASPKPKHYNDLIM
jgi:hypothetical protein